VNPQNKKRRRISARAAEVEARAILYLVEAFKSPEALAELRAGEDRRALAIEDTEDTLAAACRERDSLDRQRARLIENARYMTEDEAATAFGKWQADKTESDGRIARAEAEAEDLAGFAVTLHELFEASVGILGVGPSDETEYDIDAETGERFVISPGWADIVADLRSDAEAILARKRKDLRSESIAWLAYVAARYGVRISIERGAGSAFVYLFEGDRGRILSTVKQEVRL
jgi:hypothetical protein